MLKKIVYQKKLQTCQYLCDTILQEVLFLLLFLFVVTKTIKMPIIGFKLVYIYLKNVFRNIS